NFIGPMVITGGTVRLEASNALGSTTTGSDTQLGSAATGQPPVADASLHVIAGLSVPEPLTIGPTTTPPTGTPFPTFTVGGAPSFTSGSASFTGSMLLFRPVTLVANGTSVITFSGQISENNSGQGVTKTGT